MATATFTEVVDRAIGDPLTEAIWDDQLKDNLNQLAGAHRNLLTNGGFEVWQRGAGPFTTLVYSADRWQVSTGSGTITVTQETTTTDGSTASLKAVLTGTPPGGYVVQTLEDYRSLRGKTAQFSARVHQSVASSASLTIVDSSGQTSGSVSATTGSFVTLTASRAIGAAVTYVQVVVSFAVAGTFYLDNAMLVVGPAPAPYQPLHPQDDLARCQRYYEVITTMNYLGSANGAHSMGQWVPWAVAKGGVPTVTKNGTWAVTNCNQPSTGSAAPAGFVLFATATGAGGVQFTANSADDTITGEWNP